MKVFHREKIRGFPIGHVDDRAACHSRLASYRIVEENHGPQIPDINRCRGRRVEDCVAFYGDVGYIGGTDGKDKLIRSYRIIITKLEVSSVAYRDIIYRRIFENAVEDVESACPSRVRTIACNRIVTSIDAIFLEKRIPDKYIEGR